MTTDEIINQLLGDIVDPPVDKEATPADRHWARQTACGSFADFAKGLRDLIEAGVVQEQAQAQALPELDNSPDPLGR